jgi:hypothetical protein
MSWTASSGHWDSNITGMLVKVLPGILEQKSKTRPSHRICCFQCLRSGIQCYRHLLPFNMTFSAT